MVGYFVVVVLFQKPFSKKLYLYIKGIFLINYPLTGITSDLNLENFQLLENLLVFHWKNPKKIKDRLKQLGNKLL